MVVKDRIKAFCRAQNITVSAFEESIGVSNGYVNAISKSIGIDKIVAILEKYSNISIEWLLTGNGEMLKDGEAQSEGITPSVSYIPQVGQPFYDVDFMAGFDDVFDPKVSVPTCNIVVPGFSRATAWCNVTGHSMEPKINHGDIIALRECQVEDIQYGEVYAVVLGEIHTIKTLRKGSRPGMLRYVPTNKDYDDQEFEISRIEKVYEVIGNISKFF